MNREIKFRCWDKEDNKMLSHEELKDINWSYSELTKEDDNYVLMQYTGLKDKNGVEIYENDLCKCADVIRQVVYKDGGFKVTGISPLYNAFYELNDIDYGTTDLEVIGNIYENKELLGD